MKKILTVFLSLFLVLFSFTAAYADDASENELVIYQSSFTSGKEQWYECGANNLYVNTKEGSLSVKSRPHSYDSARRDFDLIPGTECRVSAEVFQDKVESLDFVITACVYDSGWQENWIWLATGTAKNGEWTELSGAFTVEDYVQYSIYIETVNCDTNPDFSFRNFRLVSLNAGENFLAFYNKNLKKDVDPLFTALKDIPLPDAFRTIHADGTGLIPEFEFPQLAEITETNLDKNTLTLSLSQKASFFAVEYIENEDFYKDYKGGNTNKVKIKLTYPEKSILTFQLTQKLKINNQNWETSVGYEMAKISKLSPVLNGYWLSADYPGKNYPPYNKIKNAGNLHVHLSYKPDKSLESADFSMGSLYIRTENDKSGKITKLSTSKNPQSKNWNYYMNSYINQNVPSGEILSAGHEINGDTATMVIERGDYNYKSNVASGRYPGVAIPKEATAWRICLSVGYQKDMEIPFVTTEDFITVDENNFVHFNFEAKDLNGETFPVPEIAPFFQNDYFTVPQYTAD